LPIYSLINCKQVVVLYKDELKELELRVVTKGNLALSPVNIPKVGPIFIFNIQNIMQ